MMRASMRKSEQAELCLKVAAIIPAVTAIHRVGARLARDRRV